MIKWLVVSIAIAQSFVTFILADFRHQPSSENAGIDYYLGSNLSSNGPRYEYMPVEERFEILPTQTVKTPNSEDPTRTVETRDNEGLTYQKYVEFGDCLLGISIAFQLSTPNSLLWWSWRDGRALTLWTTGNAPWGWGVDGLPEITGVPTLAEDFIKAKGWLDVQFTRYGSFLRQDWIRGYPSTLAAYYVLWVSGAHGTIIVEWAVPPIPPYFPPEMADDRPPPLHKLSDYAWLAFEADCRVNVVQGDTDNPAYSACLQGLEWLIHCDVGVDQSTMMVGETATGSDHGWLPWPGQEFETTTDAGKALVGCPNGYGVATLLVDRIPVIGHKTIDYVKVFGAGGQDPDYGQLVPGMQIAWHFTNLY